MEDELDPREEEDNVYKDKARSQLVDDDALTPEEEGFMNGYDDADDSGMEEGKEEEHEVEFE